MSIAIHSTDRAVNLDRAVTRACQRIAPTWPLDQFIAVNPYWGYVDQHISDAAALLGSQSGTAMLMPRGFYLAHWKAGYLRREHLQSAIDAAGATCTVDGLIASLYETPAAAPRLRLVTDLVDEHRDLQHAMAWRDFVTHQVSQHCAAHFDDSQAAWTPDREGGLYPSWRRWSMGDHSPRLLMGHHGFGRKVRALPDEPRALIAAAVQGLGVPESAYDAYFTALLLSINGWAAWCAYQRWQAGLAQREDAGDLTHLLAILLAWEWLLFEGEHQPLIETQWNAEWRSHERLPSLAHASRQSDWLLQQALERAYQEPLCHGLLRGTQPGPTAAPAVQAIFCIDVRSEVFRRALEASSAEVQTLGFAGFFGLPIAYNPLGTALTRPQLPGLLAPVRCVTDECDGPETGEQLARRRQQALQWRQQWSRFRLTASSAFTFVESCGLLYAGKLLKNSLAPEASPRPVEQYGLTAAQLARVRPRLPDLGGADPAETGARCDLAARVLEAMSLTQGFARLVLLAGHGSQSANNPHAAGLDCGACGGQTGEVNARVLAALLNDPAVRHGLRDRGVTIPDSTHFLAGMHNTTTDEVDLYDLDQAPASHAADLARLRQWLAQAGEGARAERAASLGIAASRWQPASSLERAIKGRATDWTQVRPEWGLANNAAFIVAPRARSRHLNLAGRTFLHDYQWRQDSSLSTLELIMTAPMLVTNWINMQYYASTVDNPRYGSGNKVLHNVVGGRIGVFEGNGGDLRIGLPLQSLHDGETLRHTPLRLSVFIEAPVANIDAIIAKHDIVRQLLDHEWLHLFQIESDQPVISQYRGGCWKAVATVPEFANAA